MELLVVGLGSMGKRRARLIRGVEPSAALAGVDFAPARREEARALGIEPYESIAAAVAARRFDAAFVCTAPLTHAGIIARAAGRGPACIHRAEPGGRRLRRAHCKGTRRRACRCF